MNYAISPRGNKWAVVVMGNPNQPICITDEEGAMKVEALLNRYQDENIVYLRMLAKFIHASASAAEEAQGRMEWVLAGGDEVLFDTVVYYNWIQAGKPRLK
jgi:hypothetical protein